MRHMKKVVAITAALATAAAGANAQRQADSVELLFASASIKPAASPLRETQRGIRLQPRGVLSATAVTLRELIEYAYQQHPFDQPEVIGGPAWIDTARFDVVGRAGKEHWIDADGASRRTWAMLRTLLRERFKLRIEEDRRNRSIYLLKQVASRGQLGPGIRPTRVDCGAIMRGEARPPQGSSGPPCGVKNPPHRLFANAVTMGTLASLLSSYVDRPVVDGTGLPGRFDLQLEAIEITAGADYQPGPSDIALARHTSQTVYIAVRRQLGLKLEPQFTTLPVLVIRQAEYPITD
jgi:uncharacterized protein (TIGR03435 family)